MTQEIPNGWKAKDLHEVIPPMAQKAVIAFCERILTQRCPENIACNAIKTLAQYEDAFEQHGLDLRFFGYWLENTFNQGALPQVVQALKQPAPQPASNKKRLNEILPPACIQKLQDFVDSYAESRLIVEPNKAMVTMLRERVLEPFREQIILEKTGITDLHFLAAVICQQLNMDPN